MSLNNPVSRFFLPDDPEKSRFRFIVVAADRARQIYRGRPPMIPTGSRKPARIAMIEAQNGLVPWEEGRS